MKEMSNLAKFVYKRTYARQLEDSQNTENWEDTVKRVIEGNVANYRNTPLLEENEEERLAYYMLNRKAMPAGRMLWLSGTYTQRILGGAGLNNCFYFSCNDYYNFVIAQDLLMLGGGIGMSVEHEFVSKLPKVKKDVRIYHKATNDADFIVPDSREGWGELTRKVLKAFFETGKGFSYSTVCVRGAGEPIKAFGGKASGPIPLINFVTKLCAIFKAREGKSIRPIDASDIICSIGEMVVAGNVRRSAIIVLGDCWDKNYLKAKRFDLADKGIIDPIPNQRAMANFSIVCDDIEDVHSLFWDTYKNGEPFGIVNRTNMKKFGRMGEKKFDSAVGVNPCGEISLESGEACCLSDIFMPNLANEEEFKEAARLMFRFNKRVTCENYHQPITDEVVKRNRRTGVGITGCLQSELFTPVVLDSVYNVIQKENVEYSKLLGVPESIRTTTVKPSGTVSLIADTTAGIHPAYSKYYIRRVRIASTDDLVPLLREAGHNIKPVIKFDNTLDHDTLVVDFPCVTPEGTPVADEDRDTFKQLEAIKTAQKYWSDNSVSVTVYYKKEDLGSIKEWLKENLSELKTISFLCHNEHGFIQAPYEAITEEEYNKAVKNIKPLDLNALIKSADVEMDDCSSGACPIK